MSVTINGTNGLVFNDSSTQNTSPFTGGLGFRNRIINGAMVIDQRNAGASVTANDGIFGADRFKISTGYTSKATIQQSTTVPAGFKNSILITSSAATSTAAGDYMTLIQPIEGLNVSDLGWGAAGAATVTLSFWVRSSLTGTFGGSINNSGNSRSYVFSYTISAANTWEQKTVTIAGDTSGTWLTTNGIGLIVRFSIAMGSTYTNTAGAWYSGDYEGATGQVNVLNTNGATFYITGVQLEKGSTATSFDYRPYGTELSLCQRYYLRNKAEQNGTSTFMVGVINSATLGTRCSMAFPVAMRTAPTMAQSGCRIYDGVSAATAISSISAQYSSTTIGCVDATCSGGGFTAGRAALMIETNSSSYVDFSAEL